MRAFLARPGLDRLLAMAPASAAPWRITTDHWTPADEAGFGRFVTAIGDSGCSSSESCLRSAANPWRGSEDRHFLDVDVDCAKLPYLLRAYYAWKNGLPFSYVDGVARLALFQKRQPGRQPRRHDRPWQRHRWRRAPSAPCWTMSIPAPTAPMPAATDGMASDFYSPALQPGSIRPGTVIYDTNGHVGIVYRVDASGRIYYMDAHPDFTISRSVYGAQFGQSPTALGGGLKNWRPLQLVGARDENGALVGGHVAMARQRPDPGFLPGAVSGHRAQSRRCPRRALFL